MRDLALNRFLPVPLDLPGDFTDQNDRFDLLLNQVAKRLEIEAFILSAGDEDYGFTLREQCLLHGIEVGRFGVINIIDSADLSDELTTMRLRFVGRKRWAHFFKGQAARHSGRKCGHEIFDVVRAAQFGRSQTQHRLVAVND